MPTFSNRSKIQIATLHPDLQRVLNLAITVTDFSVLEGLRDKERQNAAVDTGNSKVTYPNSRHNRSKKEGSDYDYKVSDAVDLAPYPIKWPDIRKQTTKEYAHRMGTFYLLAGVILACAIVLGVQLRWGGYFKSFFDGPHFERVVK